MKKFALLSTLLVLSFCVMSTIHAEESATGTSSIREQRQTFVASKTAELKEKREERKEDRQELIANFKENLQKIKDTRKQQIVSNVQDRITNRNSLWVSHWNEVLKRLSALLDKIQTKTDEASQNGKDVTAVTAKITAARTAIATAQTAVNTQSAKTYTVDITTEDALKSNTITVIGQFRSDVTAVISSINAARRAVSDVFIALGSIIGTKPTTSPVASPSATTQP